MRIEPGLLARLGGRLARGVVIITGTNGKTTTSRLLSAVLRDGGLNLVHNRSGANLLPGLASAFLEAAAGRGPAAAPDIALLEVDEATIPDAVRELHPAGVVVTNFFRDQLDRYGELDTTVSMVGRGLDLMDGKGFVALNADDPLVASLGRGRKGRVVFYGVEDPACGTREMTQTREQRNCLVCGRPLGYEVFYYGHLGRYRCPAGDFDRPTPEYAAEEVRLGGTAGSAFRMRSGDRGAQTVQVPIPGLYNVYNGLAALVAARELGLDPERSALALGRAAASFGRMEHIAVDGRDLLIALVKNPTGYNQVVRTILESPTQGGPRHFLMALNDRYADGTDISWIWDVDFEILSRSGAQVGRIVVSGTRAEDLALRLKYAGIPQAWIRMEPDLARALDAALVDLPNGATLYATPTYTAMLELRDIISRRGFAPQFWEPEA